MKHLALLAASFWVTGAYAAAQLTTLRVNAPASLVRAGNASSLVPARPIVAGDVVSAGSRGKVALQLAGSGSITLSSLGDLQVFEAQGPRGKQPAVAKLKLLAGALRVDSRAAKGRPAQDVRVNAGSLKVRIFNADAWGANTAEGDTFCLISGSVGVQTNGAEERLDKPGSCLRREPDGQLSRFAAASDAVILGAIAATRFDDLNTTLAAAVADPVIATPAAPVPTTVIAAPAASPSGSGWTVVVLSLSKPEPITARAEALVAQGLPATTRTIMVNGITMHRVAVGNFATQAEARAYAASTLSPSGIKGWASPL